MKKINQLTILFVVFFTVNTFAQTNKPAPSKLTVTDYDGNVYQTVTIGNQVWMTENLRSTHYSNGELITCFDYDNNTANSLIYGKLYRWNAAMHGAASSNSNPSNVQGVAPNGWHLPSSSEWLELAENLGGLAGAGGKMKQAGTEYWQTPNTGATNESNFTALPAGFYDFTNVFLGKGSRCFFSSSTYPDPNDYSVTSFLLRNDNGSLILGDIHPFDAVSVRCIKNDSIQDVNDEDLKKMNYNLFQNYPNPFNPTTTIKFSLNQKAFAAINIYNVKGELVAELGKKIYDAGLHTLDLNCSGLESGQYFYQLKTKEFTTTKKMLLIK